MICSGNKRYSIYTDLKEFVNSFSSLFIFFRQNVNFKPLNCNTNSSAAVLKLQ